MTQPTTEELRTLIEKAAKLMGHGGVDDWNGDAAVIYFWDGDPQNPERNYFYFDPRNNAHDSRMLAIQAGIEVYHMDDCVEAISEERIGDHQGYTENPTTADKLQCEFLAVLRCAGAVYDERERGKV